MAADKNKTENIQESVSVETLQAENEALKARVHELEVKEKVMSEDLEKAKDLFKENEALKAKIAELSETATDSKNNRTLNEKGEVKIKIIAPVAGKFLLPYNVGQEVFHQANQADEMVETRYAEYVK